MVARSLVPGFDNWVTHGAVQGRIELEIIPDGEYDRVTHGRPPTGAFKAGLRWASPQGSESDGRPTGRRGVQPSLEEITYTAGASSTARRGPWADNPIGWFCAAYGPFRRMAGGSSEVQRVGNPPGRPPGECRRRRQGADDALK